MAPWLHSQILVTSDDWNSQVSWELTCDGLAAPIRGGAPYSATHAVPPSSCTLHLMDSYGDGWQGATWSAPGWTNQSHTLAANMFLNSVSFYATPAPSPPSPSPPPSSPPPSAPSTCWDLPVSGSACLIRKSDSNYLPAIRYPIEIGIASCTLL